LVVCSLHSEPQSREREVSKQASKEGINKKPPPRRTATQTVAGKTKRSQVAPPRQALPNVQVPKTDNQTSASKSTGKAVPTKAVSKPERYASVAKDANKDEEWAKVKPKRLHKKPEALILKKKNGTRRGYDGSGSS